MESRLVTYTQKPPTYTPELITPDMVRGLSLGRVTELYGTNGLYVRTIDSLQRHGFGDNALVQNSLQLGLALHRDDQRTSGHYNDHLMRVMLHVVENLGIKDENVVAAAPIHDAFEDHPRDLVFSLTGEKPATRQEALKIGARVLANLTNQAVVDIALAVTNPPVPEGMDKIEAYTENTMRIMLGPPEPRALKDGDFIENAVGNHATVGDKQRYLDLKYLPSYRIHSMGLWLPDGLVVGEHRRWALDMLSKGHARALTRLAMYEAQHSAA